MKNILFVVVAILLQPTYTFCQTDQSNEIVCFNSDVESYKILSPDNEIIIPFEFYRNKLRFKAKVNGKECNMMIDNGSLWDELLFFGSSIVDSIGFIYSGETSIGFNKANISDNVKIEFDDIIFFHQTAVITRYDPKLPNIWEGTDGQVSATFFKNFIVKINFDESVIELIPPKKFKYSDSGQEISMKPGPFDSRLVTAEIVLNNGETINLDLQIDLGGLYPLYLPLGKYDNITVSEKASEITLGAGLQLHKGFLDYVLQINFGKISLKDVKTAFIPVSKDTEIYGNTMIGLPLLQQFNVIFDYFNNRLILEKLK